jgi:hypothetical protein
MPSLQVARGPKGWLADKRPYRANGVAPRKSIQFRSQTMRENRELLWQRNENVRNLNSDEWESIVCIPIGDMMFREIYENNTIIHTQNRRLSANEYASNSCRILLRRCHISLSRIGTEDSLPDRSSSGNRWNWADLVRRLVSRMGPLPDISAAEISWRDGWSSEGFVLRVLSGYTDDRAARTDRNILVIAGLCAGSLLLVFGVGYRRSGLPADGICFRLWE